MEKMQSVDLNYWLPGDILQKADKMSMAHSLEVRVPFLDKEVFDFAAKLPKETKIAAGTTKYIFRKAVSEFLPQETDERRKLGFPIPIRVWLRQDDWYQRVKELFTSKEAEEFFHTEKLLQLLNDQARETIEQKIEERVDSDMSDMQTSAGYAAIWVALSNGYSSDAIDAARSAGAMGGTILKGRRQNSERISQKLGISMQEEEEFVVIVTPREKKAAVMNAISDACGLRTDAHGIILSLPVDEVIGLETGENTL